MPVTDTQITDWSTTISDNVPSQSDGIAGLLDDHARNIRSVVRAEAENKQWVRLAVTPTYVSATSFSVPGDLRTDFAVGRKVKVTLTGGTKYGTIDSRTFASAVTTVTVRWDLETFDDAAFVVASDDSIEITGDFTARFVFGTDCEFWALGAPPRIPRAVASSSFGGGVTTVTFETPAHFLQVTDYTMRVSSEGIDNTISDVQLGTFTPALLQSGWPDTVMAGQFQITADNTVGPFAIELPWRQADADFVPLIQPTDANTTPSGVQWALPEVVSRNTTHFVVQFPTAINTGPVLTYDFVILRGQP